MSTSRVMGEWRVVIDGQQIAATRASLADAEAVRDYNGWEGQVIEHRTVTIIETTWERVPDVAS